MRRNRLKIVCAGLLAMCFLTGCNNNGYTHATIKLTNGEIITVDVESYYIHYGVVDVTTPEGKLYTIDTINCTLTNQ